MSTGTPLGQVAKAALLVIGLWGLARGLWLLRDLLFIGFLAALFGLFLSVFVDRLQRVRIPRALGGPIVLLLFGAVLTLIGVFVLPVLFEQLSELSSALPRAVDSTAAWFAEVYARITGRLTHEQRNLPRDLGGQLRTLGGRLAAGLIPVLGSIGGAITGTLVVLFAGLYLAIEQELIRRGLLRLVPPGGRARAALGLAASAKALRGWLLGTAINMVVIGTCIAIGLKILGVPTALALGVITGFLEFIPVFGPVLAAIPAMAIALIISPGKALSVALLYTVVQQAESNLLAPLVMKGTVKLPPSLSLFFQVAMAVLFGFIGLLVAVPALATTVVLVDKLYIEPMEERAAERGGPPPGKLPSEDARPGPG